MADLLELIYGGGIPKLLRKRESLYADQTSLSDHLRPPFPSPIAEVVPISRGASNVLREGFEALPESYRHLLLSEPPPPNSTTHAAYQRSRDGTGIGGLFSPPRRNDPGLGGYMQAESRGAYAHELVHLLLERLGIMANPSVEEYLADRIGRTEGEFYGYPPRKYFDRVTDLDRFIEEYARTPRWQRRFMSTPESVQ